jgi:hypothetical protein
MERIRQYYSSLWACEFNSLHKPQLLKAYLQVSFPKISYINIGLIVTRTWSATHRKTTWFLNKGPVAVRVHKNYFYRNINLLKKGKSKAIPVTCREGP